MPRISYTNLQHGDVILFEKRRQRGFLPSAIRLVTGSKYTHVGVVINVGGVKLVLEQLTRRRISLLKFYYTEQENYEFLHVVRPRFGVPLFISPEWFRDRKYGYLGLLDSLVNHSAGLIDSKWKYKPTFSGMNPKNLDCSGLVATVLNLGCATDWVKVGYESVVEPDDFANHPENFDYLGELVFS